MKNCSDHFVFDFADAVIIRESVGDICIGDVRAQQLGEEPSVSARIDGDKLSLDFVIPALFVDSEMSDTSVNPVSNSVIKKYVDEKRLVFDEIFADTAGRFAYQEQGRLTQYDLLICYASADPSGKPCCFPVPIKYYQTSSETMSIQVSDGSYYTVFTFNSQGCSSSGSSGAMPGRYYALYGIKF